MPTESQWCKRHSPPRGLRLQKHQRLRCTATSMSRFYLPPSRNEMWWDGSKSGSTIISIDPRWSQHFCRIVGSLLEEANSFPAWNLDLDALKYIYIYEPLEVWSALPSNIIYNWRRNIYSMFIWFINNHDTKSYIFVLHNLKSITHLPTETVALWPARPRPTNMTFNVLWCTWAEIFI